MNAVSKRKVHVPMFELFADKFSVQATALKEVDLSRISV